MVNPADANINIVSPEALDPNSWNGCIASCDHGTLFASMDYLSSMSEHWCGLVVGDYEAVLPLIYKRKWGVKYLAAPPFVKQLGLIGNWHPEQKTNILAAIHQFAAYGDVVFNFKNEPLCRGQHLEKNNYVINLNEDYDQIAGRYHKSLSKRLNRIQQEHQLFFTKGNRLEVIDYYESFLGQKTDLNLKNDFNRLRQFLQTESGESGFEPYRVVNKAGKVLLHGIYAKDKNRVYKFMTFVTREGRTLNASAFALDYIIRQNVGTDKYFDFMGSSIAGVRNFIKSFGAVNQPYFLYHYNRRPWPFNLLKR